MGGGVTQKMTFADIGRKGVQEGSNIAYVIYEQSLNLIGANGVLAHVRCACESRHKDKISCAELTFTRKKVQSNSDYLVSRCEPIHESANNSVAVKTY